MEYQIHSWDIYAGPDHQHVICFCLSLAKSSAKLSVILCRTLREIHQLDSDLMKFPQIKAHYRAEKNCLIYKTVLAQLTS